MRSLLIAVAICGWAHAADPVRSAWIMSPSVGASMPDVHSVTSDERFVTVRSAGVSTRYLGALQPAPVPGEGLREFTFRIPLHPEAETGRRARVPVEIVGVFVNGMPIYNQFESLSWNGANLWHYDALAMRQLGGESTHPAPPGLIEQLARDGRRHSPLIAFALDGYPIYGPWAFADDGKLRRMRSSYRLRAMSSREDWPDGTRLTPGQYGPAVDDAAPLGTFAEDYEFVAGSGDLDESNGRFAITPEYPDGTYAYFLATGAEGRLTFPYLIGPRFHGRVTVDESPAREIGAKGVRLSVDRAPTAGQPVRFRLQALDAHRERIRAFEYVHERPIHFLVASADLAEFDHIHPELTSADAYEVGYTFAHGGRYRVWADYSLPGQPPRVDAFDIEVAGKPRVPTPLVESDLTWSGAGLTVTTTPDRTWIAGEDIGVTLKLSDATATLSPYLGAWAHIIVIGEGWSSFSHAHPVEAAAAIHTHVVHGPPPDAIHFVTNFPAAGTYKMWVQLQQAGRGVTIPFTIRVGAGRSPAVSAAPEDAIRIRVDSSGYEPARVEIPAGRDTKLAFRREGGCASEVVFPALGLRATLPIGETVIVNLPAQPAGEIAFACGMGMYRGMIVATEPRP